MYMIEYVMVTMFMISLLTFCRMHKHLLMTLLSMEMLTLMIFLLFFIFLTNYGCGGYFMLVYLTFAVCEGCLGLAILVSLIRCCGNDMIMPLSVLSW
uniref:NADH-ubiquinone oxidoreductase chain 4L n=1 Tax=Gorpis humeralis TaxID=1041165 RepID=K7NBG2_9HEMI|nr:NADH dehydrogenase subunit 4L [Gorpis humeralis]AEH21209.1 NADH dehydrogenase subunit 4L [Gorpis humeralis]